MRWAGTLRKLKIWDDLVEELWADDNEIRTQIRETRAEAR